MTHFQKFMSEAMANGYSYEDAVSDPRAKEAARRDDAAARQAHLRASKSEYLAAFNESRRQAGSQTRGFLDQEEMLLAMQDEAYDSNPEYRAAVEEILAQTPAEVIGVSATAVAADGTRIHLGQPYSTERATPESMLENAYRDMVLEQLANIDHSTAKGRYEYMQYLTDPKNAWLVEYQESLVTSDSQRTHQAMLDSQASGHVDRIEIVSESNDGSVPQGSFGQGEGNQ
ncbi:MAG: hypothetical protein NDI90_21780 [Nitrospira sp. BO4]|jgi:hypothetical protein|nr:hypothetical protein [Nitrospira sp. BO4]